MFRVSTWIFLFTCMIALLNHIDNHQEQLNCHKGRQKIEIDTKKYRRIKGAKKLKISFGSEAKYLFLKLVTTSWLKINNCFNFFFSFFVVGLQRFRSFEFSFRVRFTENWEFFKLGWTTWLATNWHMLFNHHPIDSFVCKFQVYCNTRFGQNVALVYVRDLESYFLIVLEETALHLGIGLLITPFAWLILIILSGNRLSWSSKVSFFHDLFSDRAFILDLVFSFALICEI